MNATTRAARREDRAAIVALIGAMGGHGDILERSDPLAVLRHVTASPCSRALVAERDGALVGVAVVTALTTALYDRREAWLEVMAVAPDARRSGVGAALLAAVEREALVLGCTALTLESSMWRDGAHAFYHGQEFAEIAPARRFVRAIDAARTTVQEQFLAAAGRAATGVMHAIAGLERDPDAGRGADGAPTTAADAAAEDAILVALGGLSIPIVSEEAGILGGPLQPGGLWVCVDPLDGTRNFRAGFPAYATSMALVSGSRPIAAFVGDLVTGRRYHACEGQGAFRDGMRVSARRGPLVGAPSPEPGVAPPPVPPGAERVRMSGSTVSDFVRVADGSLAAFVALDRAVTHVHDLAAAYLLVREAGGVVFDADGDEPKLVPNPKATYRVVAAADADLAYQLCGVRPRERATP